MARVDAHCHFWDLSRGDYGWLDASNSDLAPIVRDYCPGDLAPLRNAANVEKVVVVQAAATEAETDYLLELADRNDEIAGVVGWADFESDGVVQRLEKWTDNPKFKGVRPMLQDIENTDWLLENPKADIWPELVRLGLRFDALVQPRHLPVIYKFCKSNPDLALVIDHAAKPKSALEGNGDAFVFWSEHMTMLARDTNAHCKLSGLLSEMEASDLKEPRPILQRYVDVLLEAFGPERLMWGSDWPVVTLASSYQQWSLLAQSLISEIDPGGRDKILGGTASAFYGLGVAQ